MTIDTRQQLLAQINSAITLNGTGAITGPILNNILDTMVNSALFNTGTWSQYTSYYPLDIVSYNGASYIAILPNVNITPNNSTYWAVFVSAIAPGASGPSTSVQFNSAGTLAGSSNLLFDGSTLTANALLVSTTATVSGSVSAGSASITGAVSAASATITGALNTSTAAVTTSATINALTLTSGTSPALLLPNATETTTASSTAATGTINFDVITQSILYYTLSSTGNWTINVRGNASNSLNSFMATGQTITIAFLATNGSTGYYQTAFTIDGTSVTPKWQGGTAPTSGDTSALDVYIYSILKTGSATYTVLATLAKFQ